MWSFRGFARSFCRRLAVPVVALLLALTVAPSRAAAQEAITEDLNTAAAVVGIGVVGADVGFTVADAILAARKQRLSPGWSVVEIVCAALIAVGATVYSFQARDNELFYTIPIALWTGLLTAHGITSLAHAHDESTSLGWMPTYAMDRPGVALWGRF